MGSELILDPGAELVSNWSCGGSIWIVSDVLCPPSSKTFRWGSLGLEEM